MKIKFGELIKMIRDGGVDDERIIELRTLDLYTDEITLSKLTDCAGRCERQSVELTIRIPYYVD